MDALVIVNPTFTLKLPLTDQEYKSTPLARSSDKCDESRAEFLGISKTESFHYILLILLASRSAPSYSADLLNEPCNCHAII